MLAAKEVLEVIYPYVLADPKIGDLSSVFYTSLGRARTYFKDDYGDPRTGLELKLEDLVTFPLFHNTLLLMCALMEFKGDLRVGEHCAKYSKLRREPALTRLFFARSSTKSHRTRMIRPR